ncbi:nitrite reductase [Ferroacidibacillus organovorans]|uniref:Nitrite reductase n=2 Tax=Ferroacidibacillus organovorans TaxID=1765683 RepID=A0A117SXX1_9BACL|nr:nitrite reductase [Ferroacidibacillus organovorans]
MCKVKFAISPEIRVGGRRFTASDLSKIAELVGEDSDIELTTMQQLIVEMDELRAENAKEALRSRGMGVYEVGHVVKNLAVCNFCKGAESEGLEAARELDKAIAGRLVPFPVRVGYSGCPNACGESLAKDIGIVKIKDTFNVYVGGETKTLNASSGKLMLEKVAGDLLPSVVNQIIEVYQKNGRKRERFSHFMKRYGFDTLQNELTI